MTDGATGARHPAVISSYTAAAPATIAGGPAVSAGRFKELLTRDDLTRRLSCVVDSVSSWLKCASRKEPSSLAHLCNLLARGIDFSVTSGEVYANAHDLPPIIKQVYKFRNETCLKPAILMLLLSAKSACSQGWFSAGEENEIAVMANEMSGFFCFGSSLLDETKASSTISTVMARFYPQLNFGSLLASFEAKHGYRVLVVDFIIPWNVLPQTNIRLLVARTDENLESSSCLISPPRVNILVNGRTVERRTVGLSDIGPQLPTNISKFLKYGTNIIQAIGFFSGDYIIAVASMSAMPIGEFSSLQDYISPDVGTDPPDDDIIEGPSKISLNCPISFKRIKTPVKGHLCKHHQCFDYENYVAMNSKRPSWRCPHCNHPVSFVDLRIDRQMCKILAETGEDSTRVVIGSDGSWRVVEYRDAAEERDGETPQLDTADCVHNGAPTGSSSFVDLTTDADDLQGRPRTENNEPSEAIQATAPQGYAAWSLPPGMFVDPVVTDAVALAPVREPAEPFSNDLQFLRTLSDPQAMPRPVPQTGTQQPFPGAAPMQLLPTFRVQSVAQSCDSQQQWHAPQNPLLTQQMGAGAQNNHGYWWPQAMDQSAMQQNLTFPQLYSPEILWQPQAMTQLPPPLNSNSLWPQQAANPGPSVAPQLRRSTVPAHLQGGLTGVPRHFVSHPHNP